MFGPQNCFKNERLSPLRGSTSIRRDIAGGSSIALLSYSIPQVNFKIAGCNRRKLQIQLFNRVCLALPNCLSTVSYKPWHCPERHLLTCLGRFHHPVPFCLQWLHVYPGLPPSSRRSMSHCLPWLKPLQSWCAHLSEPSLHIQRLSGAR